MHNRPESSRPFLFFCNTPVHEHDWLYQQFTNDACRRRTVLLSYDLVPDCGATDQSLGKLSHRQPLNMMPHKITGLSPRQFAQGITRIHDYKFPRLHCHLTLLMHWSWSALRCTRAHITANMITFSHFICPGEASMPTRPTLNHTCIMHKTLHLHLLPQAYQHTPVPQAALFT